MSKKKKPDKHYYLTRWHGMDNYQCKYCPFSTLDGEAALNAHVIDKHFAAKAAPEILVADKRGRPVEIPAEIIFTGEEPAEEEGEVSPKEK